MKVIVLVLVLDCKVLEYLWSSTSSTFFKWPFSLLFCRPYTSNQISSNQISLFSKRTILHTINSINILTINTGARIQLRVYILISIQSNHHIVHLGCSWTGVQQHNASRNGLWPFGAKPLSHFIINGYF